MHSGNHHHLVQHPSFPDNSLSYNTHKKGNESSSVLCEHHLKDIRAELKAKPPPNYLPSLKTATFPGTALVDQSPRSALTDGLLASVGCFSQN